MKITKTLAMCLIVTACQGQTRKVESNFQAESDVKSKVISETQNTTYSDENQQEFEKFVIHFKQRISLPIDDMEMFETNDTISIHWVNNIIIRNEKERPKYIDKNGEYKEEKEFYGLYQEDPFHYEFDGKPMVFYPKIHPIGRVFLNDNFISLIVKIHSFETTYYDLWNFDKKGNPLSFVCLFLGYRDDNHSPEVTYVASKSTIDKEGVIDFNFDHSDLIIHRVYKLNEDGYFKILEEQMEDTMNDD